jgi:GAF domain-containing protein
VGIREVRQQRPRSRASTKVWTVPGRRRWLLLGLRVKGMNSDMGTAAALTGLTDSLVADHDVVDFMHTLVDRSVDLLGQAGGLMLSDGGELQILATSSYRVKVLERFQLDNREGPCLECFTSGAPTVDIGDDPRWPRFSKRRKDLNYFAVYAVPLHLGDKVFGALNTFRTVEQGKMTSADQQLQQAFADLATIGLVQQRALRERTVLAEQLQTALHSRVLIEQAKGVLAGREGIPLDVAFTVLRSYARSNQLRLSDVARDVIEGVLTTGQLAEQRKRSPRRRS